jgi:transporter family-2 protein
MVAGQMAGALMVDLVAPAPGEAVTVATVVGVALTMAAVVISGRTETVRNGRYS